MTESHVVTVQPYMPYNGGELVVCSEPVRAIDTAFWCDSTSGGNVNETMITSQPQTL